MSRSGTSVLKQIEAAAYSGIDKPRCITPLRPNAGLLGRIPLAVPAPTVSPRSMPGTGRTATTAGKDLTPRGTDGVVGFNDTQTTSQQLHELPSFDDAHSHHERAVADEINLLRQNPTAYAAMIEQQVVLTKPFVVGEMTVGQLQKHTAERRATHEAACKEFADITASKKREIQNLRDEWDRDDNDKKKGKKAPPKKSVSTDLPADTTELERNEAIQTIEQTYDVQLAQVQQQMQAAAVSLNSASLGIATVERCLTKLRSLKDPLPPLQYSRGLSLAARDVADAGKAISEASAVAKRYGSTHSAVWCFMHIDRPATVRQTIMEALLGLQDACKNGSAVALDPRGIFIGCGWRRNKRRAAVTTILIASQFEEFGAIHSRNHVPLQDVKRILPLALQSCSTRVIQLQTHLAISMVQPTEHPVECGNQTTLILQAAPGIHLCAVLRDAKEPEPKAPTICTGEVIVQRCQGDANHIEVRIITPHRGPFRVTLFARNDDFSAGFVRVGAVELQASSWSILGASAQFPTLTADFDERSATLISPLEGILLPETVYDFDILLPESSYLSKDLERLQGSLSAAEGVSACSAASSEALYATFDEANAALQAAQKKCADDTEAMQQEIQSQSRELNKKKGKDADKSKQLIQELEEQMKDLQVAVVEKEAVMLAANEKIQAHRRATRRASAQRRRFESEKQRCIAAVDRSYALQVEISLDERRAALVPTDATNSRYTLSLRTPPGSGAMTLFVNGSSLVTWVVSDNSH